MTEDDVDIEAKLNNVACLIKFIIILDNNGKIIYSKYYTDKNTPEKQRDFEKQLCYQVKNLNILPGELDIFSYDEFHIFVKIIGEIAYFIGISENDNECLGYNFCRIFENSLSNILQENFDRNKIFNSLEKIMLLIDEMVYNGIVLKSEKYLKDYKKKIKYLHKQKEIDRIESIENLITNQEQGGSKFISFSTSDSGNTGGGGLFSTLFSGARSIFG